MKHLANCTPREFLKQTNRIRRQAEKWLDWTRLKALRHPLRDDLPLEAQIKESALALLDAVLSEHPDETAELLGLMCFIEPEDLDLSPFDRRGGLGRFYDVFGEQYEAVLMEMNIELVA